MKKYQDKVEYKNLSPIKKKNSLLCTIDCIDGRIWKENARINEHTSIQLKINELWI